MSTEQEVIDLIVDELGVNKEDVSPGKSFIEDFNVDSLELTQLMMTLEDRFQFEIAEQDQEKMKTVGDVIAFIEAKKGA